MKALVRAPFYRQILFMLAAFLFLMWVAACHISNYREFAPDDAFITYIYGRNLAEGNGFYYNPRDSEPTEGFSSLLHVLLVATGYLLNVDGLTTTRALNALIYGVIGILIAGGAARLCREKTAVLLPSSIIVMLLAFSVKDTRMHLCSGMETMIHTGIHAAVLLWTVSLLYGSFRRWFMVAQGVVLFFLLSISRPDGLTLGVLYLFLAAILSWFSSDTPRKRVVLSTDFLTWGGLAVLFCIYLLVKFLYFGYLLPNPYYVKTHHAIFGSVVPTFPGWKETGLFFVARCLPLLLISLVLFWLGKGSIVLIRDGLAFLVPGVLAAAAYALTIHEVSFGYRFEFPMLVPFAVLLTCAVFHLARRTKRVMKGALFVAIALTCLALNPGWFPFAGWVRHPMRSAIGWINYVPQQSPLARIGLDLAETHLEQNAVILLSGAGQVPYYSRYYAIDWIGLNTNRLSGRTPMSLDEVWAYIDGFQPDVIYSLLPPADRGVSDKTYDPGFNSPAVQGFLRGHSCSLFRYWDRERLEEMFYKEMCYVREHYVFGAAYLLQENGAVILYVRKNSPFRDCILGVLYGSKRSDPPSSLITRYVTDVSELQ